MTRPVLSRTRIWVPVAGNWVIIRSVTWFVAATVSTMTASSSRDRVPALDRPRFVCPHSACAAFAQQSWTDLMYQAGSDDHGEPWHQYLEPREYPAAPTPAVWRGAQCGSCDQWSLWRAGEMVHPARHRLGERSHPEMPPEVRELHTEAGEVAAVSRRAGAALARASVERLLKHVDPDAPKNASLEK